MSITASEIFLSVDLGNGAFSVTERHTDSTGKIHEWRYIAGPGVNTTTKLAEHAEQLAVQLAEAEAEGVIV